MTMIDDDLFGKSREKRRLSRKMKRANKKQHNRSGGSGDNHIRRIDSEVLTHYWNQSGIKLMQIVQLVVEYNSTGKILDAIW